MLFCCKRKTKILEFPNKYYFGKEDIKSIPLELELVKTMNTFCIENNVYTHGAIISLSGGVDSMVVLAILLRLKMIHNFPIYACSIDYNNRDEQIDEMDFLLEYCDFNNVQFYLSRVKGFTRKQENSGSRNEYEDESRKIRFDLYNKVLSISKSTGVFVGHHKDDIIENIFTNSMKGGNLLDLEVTKKINCIHGVNIFRPLLDYHKQPIYDLAHSYNIPYFLDTTPKWSRRGKMRNEIFPLFDSVFTKSWRLKIKDLGEQSNEWGSFINDFIINPWFNTIEIGKYGFIMEFRDYPKIVYTNVILKAMHSIHKHMLKNSSIDKIIEAKDNENVYNKQIILDSGMVMFIDSANVNSFYIFNKDEIQNEINRGINEINRGINEINREINEITSTNFINGKINYNKPKEEFKEKYFSINKKRYSEMNINLPIELVKIFMFPCK